MNNDFINSNIHGTGEAGEPLPRQEVLLSRVVDGEATDGEWAEFRALADGELPVDGLSAWRDLAKAQRSQALMSAAIGDELAGAERIEAPARGLRLVGSRSGPLGRAIATGGWVAVAAAMALAWANGWMAKPPTSGGMQQNQAGIIPAGYVKIESPEDAIRVYKEKGQKTGTVVQEMPQRVLVQALAKECCPGQYTVMYARVFVEKADVKDLRQFAQDESGKLRLIEAGMPQVNKPRNGM